MDDPQKSDDSTTQATQVQPVAPKLKEQAPVQADSGQRTADSAPSEVNYAEADRVAKEEGDEYWEKYAREIELEKQIVELGGVEKVESGEVAVPAGVAKEMGINEVSNAQVSTSNAQNGFSVGGTSLTDDQLTAGISKPTSSGFRWLVEWFIYQLLKAHFHIRRIKGKITREQGKGDRAQGTDNKE